MWFRSKPANPAAITAEQLHAEFAALKGSVRALELEWERTYDKLRGIVARMSRKNGEIGADEPAAPATPGTTLPMGRSQLTGGRVRRNY